MRARGDLRLTVLVLAALALALAPSSAIAKDPNSLPPELNLWPSGMPTGHFGPATDEGLGSYFEDLAYFSTSSSELPGADPSSEYTVGSTVTFSCLLDGRPIPCSAEHEPELGSIGGTLLKSRGKRKCARKRRGRCRRPRPRPVNPEQTPETGPFTGQVPFPSGLTHGPHTVTVIATDEDGTDPTPPSVEIFLDLQPPAAPVLVEAPPRVSRDGMPRFRFRATDDHRFPGPRDRPGEPSEPFTVTLRRTSPPGGTLQSGNPFGKYMSLWREHCGSPTECSASARPVYEAWGGGFSFGLPTWLRPGRYLFTVAAEDAVGNISAVTTHRFRILRSKKLGIRGRR